jgi:fumarate reductase subunit D
MAKSRGEAFWWSLFSAGGVVAALLVPILVLIVGIVIPLGWGSAEDLSYDRLRALAAHPVSKLVLLAIFFFSFFHCAHRIRHTLYEVGFRAYQTPIALVCYGAAAVGVVIAFSVILSL